MSQGSRKSCFTGLFSGIKVCSRCMVVMVALLAVGLITYDFFRRDSFWEVVVDVLSVLQTIISLPNRLPFFYSFSVGPVYVYVSPLSLWPFALPQWVPFQQSFVAISLNDQLLPLDALFLNLHLYSALFIYLPPLPHFSLSSIDVTISSASVSVKSIPFELVGLSLSSSLTSLLRLRMSKVKLGIQMFPGIIGRKQPAEAPAIPDQPRPNEPVLSKKPNAHLSVSKTPQMNVVPQGEDSSTLATYEGTIVSILLGLWIHASRRFS